MVSKQRRIMSSFYFILLRIQIFPQALPFQTLVIYDLSSKEETHTKQMASAEKNHMHFKKSFIKFPKICKITGKD
jgi:hypothetical protein